MHTCMHTYIHAYIHADLQPQTIAAVRSQLEEHGAALLSGFLHPNLAEQISDKAAKADAKEGLGGGALPAHDVGTSRKGCEP